MSASVLTIGIPTYNRAVPLSRQLASVEDACVGGLINVVVVDDGSSDGTSEALASLQSRGFQLLRNEQNIGYGLTFCRLLSECRTPYMLVSADDDLIAVDALPPLISWLRRTTPDFVSTQWLNWEGAVYRGKMVERPIAAAEFRVASGHAPGLLYKVEAAKPHLAEVERLVRSGDPLAVVYPQLVLAAHLILEGRCLWYPHAVITEGSGLPSQLMDAAGRRFGDPMARIAQMIALDSILTGLNPGTSRIANRRRREMIRENARGFYWNVRESFRALGSSGCAPRLDRSATRWLMWRPLSFLKRSQRTRPASLAPHTGKQV